MVEAKVPFIKGLFEQQGCKVEYLPASMITPGTVADADALITRTRTRCDASLLAGSRCSVIATATIGTDHIDSEWCSANNIKVFNAPGCNAPAVAQYVLDAIINRYRTDPDVLKGLTVGIIGVGHVGSIVARWAQSLGMDTLLCDPPRAEVEKDGGFVSMEEIAANADIITVHTPLTHAPEPHPTFHIIDKEWLSKLKRRPLLINSARGSVTDTGALIDAYDSGLIGALAIDCWEGEPEIDRALLDRAFIATPHIAGYSLQGKQRASQMAADAVANALGLEPVTLACGRPAPPPEKVSIESIITTCDLFGDTAALKANPGNFEILRDTYNLRNEP